MRVEKDFEEFVKLLNEHKVKYLIIGAYALAFHSTPRNTGDIDFLIKPNKANAIRILKVLKEFGFGKLEITINDLLKKSMVIQLGYEPNRIDIITSISGVEISKVFSSKVKGKFGNQTVNFISYQDLIKNKASIGRKKDLADLEVLLKYKKKKHK
jgi:hypothetical protein